MENITINCGCCNGHDAKQAELWRVIDAKIKELWPEIQNDSKFFSGLSVVHLFNDYVDFRYTVDSSD